MGDSYYTLTEATEGVGVFPQHQSMSEGYDYNAPNSIRHLPLYTPADFEPNLNTIIIEPGAKKTDLLSSSVFVGAFLVSTKFKTLLQGFTLAPHTFYPAPIRHGAKPLTAEYHLLHMPHLSRVSGDPTPREANDLIAPDGVFLDLFTLHRPSRLAGTYVSPRLAGAIENAGLTGIRLGHGKLRMPG